MVLGKQAKIAFDLDKEDPRTADRYGKSAWGRYTLMARRLVEAGVTFVTVDMPHWDDHANIKESARDEVEADGSSRRGIAGRPRSTWNPRRYAGGGDGRVQPHAPTQQWPGWAKQRSRPRSLGQRYLGDDGRRWAQDWPDRWFHQQQRRTPRGPPATPYDILATVYHVLGIDYRQSFLDHTGRPVPILGEGEPIKEII